MANLQDYRPFLVSGGYLNSTFARSSDEGANEAPPEVSESRRRGAVDICDADAGGEGGGGGGGGSGSDVPAVRESGVEARVEGSAGDTASVI